MKTTVLFICVHNSARSQMAEAYLKMFGGNKFEVESAGIESGKLDPSAIEAMKLDGIDISNNQTKDVFNFFKEGKLFSYVITVCDKKAAEQCPIFPGIVKIIHWPFEDPSQFTGTQDEKLQQTIQVRDQIKQAVKDFVKQVDSEI